MNIATPIRVGATLEDLFDAPIPRLPRGYPSGWMSARDLTVLDNAALRTEGDVLEIGPRLGRSTTAIAAGLRARKAWGLDPVKFDTIDFGITAAEEWTRRFGERFNLTKAGGRLADAVYHPGGTIAVLIQNLRGIQLLGHVTHVIRGDFLETPLARRYAMIFCDATHSDAEIDRHLPKIAEHAAPGALLVFDDIVTEQRADRLCSYLKVGRRMLTRNVHPRRRDRCKLLVVELAR